MRTTLTIEPDVAQKLKVRMTIEKVSLKEAVNRAIRLGLEAENQAQEKKKFTVEPHACGLRPGVDPDKINQLLDELEADEMARKLSGETRKTDSLRRT